jgi:ribulose 1,5-bisphosphate synthetase/thiazole synthase
MKKFNWLMLWAGMAVVGVDAKVLVEAEAFENTGGWVVDQQFMDLMGSPFLMAHGLGEPVADAETTVELPDVGTYRIWVRTRDWVAPWNAPGAPGKFKLLLDGVPLKTTFGTEGAEWHWQDGGMVKLPKMFKLSLHDLTGFNGRCDAILFSRDQEFLPPDGGEALATYRGLFLGWDATPVDVGTYDLVVVGGGIAGCSAAVTAARNGLKVALIQDRPVLGGNGSSEVRVWHEGHTNKEPYPRIGDIVNELVRPKSKEKGSQNAKDAEIYDDARKLRVVTAEPNITLLLEHRGNQVEMKGRSIAAVIAQHTRSGKRIRVSARWVLDSTGDGVIGQLAGADSEMTEKGHMGTSNLWNVDAVEKNEYQLICECEDTDPVSLNFAASDTAAPFPRCPWAVDLTDQSFPGRKGKVGQWGKSMGPLGNLGNWFWESGFDLHAIDDMERVRDQNLRAMFGAWDTLKNVDGLYPNHRLKWAAYIAGKRESRRLLGDVILSADDFRALTDFPDKAYPCSWHIDLHEPNPKFVGEDVKDAFISRATTGKQYKYVGPYWAPYRTLYSRNISNLFMAGRNVSVTHEGLGPVRVMKTTGMMGEIVGMAASVCKEYDCMPREVYQNHLEELQELKRKGGGKLE